MYYNNINIYMYYCIIEKKKKKKRLYDVYVVSRYIPDYGG